MRKARIFLMRHTIAVDIAEAFCATSALFYLYFPDKTNCLPTVLIMICLTLLFRKLSRYRDHITKDARIVSCVVSAILSIALSVTGNIRFTRGFINAFEAYRFIMGIIGLFFLYFRLLCHLYAQVLRQTDSGTVTSQLRPQSNRRMFFINAAICFCCYLPYFLAAYPAILTFDSVWQINQAFGIDAYSNHHPMIHTLIIQFFLGAGQSLFRNYSSGLALYAVVQMLFLSVTFAYAVRCIEEMHAPRWLRFMFLLFYALFPVHAFYSVTVWKDIPFGGFALLFTISLWRLTRLCDQQKNPFSALAFVFCIRPVLLHISQQRLVCVHRLHPILSCHALQALETRHPDRMRGPAVGWDL